MITSAKKTIHFESGFSQNVRKQFHYIVCKQKVFSNTEEHIQNNICESKIGLTQNFQKKIHPCVTEEQKFLK